MTILRDLRHAGRSLRKRPGFTAVAVLTLALGIGANTAIFSVVNGVLLRPLPFPDADRLTTVWMSNPRQGIERDVTSYPNFVDWRERSESFREMVAVPTTTLNLTGSGRPEEIRGARVTEGFFRMLGVEPAPGRAFRVGEARSGGARVAVLSHGLWTRRFGSDAGVVGRTVELDGTPHTVVGVMPEGIAFPAGVEVWTPLVFTAGLEGLRDARGALWLQVFGRLADGVTLAEAQAEMSTIAAGLEESYPAANEGMGVLLEPLRDTLVGDVRPALMVLLAAVGLVLLMACANVANLLMARGTRRAREIALRVALGAGRGRIGRDILTESLVLALVGGAAGVGLALLGVRALVRFGPADLPRVDAIGVDATVLIFTLAASVLTALACGLPPAIQGARSRPAGVLREGGHGSAGGDRLGRWRPALVGGQFALAVVLLTGAGLLLRSFVNLQRVDPGFDPGEVVSFRLSLPDERYATEDDVRALYAALLPELTALPGVESADAVSNFFLSRLPQSSSISIEGRPDLPDALSNLPVAYDAVTPGFFRTLRIPIRRGRGFDETDRTGSTLVAVVNEALARGFFGTDDVVGRRFTFGSPTGEDTEWATIVGVVGDARRSGLARPARPAAYFPLTQYAPGTMTLVVRAARSDPLTLMPAVRRAVAAIDSDQPLANVRTLGQGLARSIEDRRYLMQLLGLFATVALLLAGVGIYGVTAYVVGQRTREIGVRVALGARAADIVRMVVGQGMRAVLIGLAVGLGGAILLTRALSAFVYDVPTTDPVTYAAVVLALVALAAAANYLPARRAAKVRPMSVLRDE